MDGDRMKGRLAARRAAWRNTKHAKAEGFKAPGSNKKDFPQGQGQES